MKFSKKIRKIAAERGISLSGIAKSVETSLQLNQRPSKIVLVGTVGSMSKEDGGSALIANMDDLVTIPDDGSFFVRLQSWSEAVPPRHTTLESLRGKKIWITIEVL